MKRRQGLWVGILLAVLGGVLVGGAAWGQEQALPRKAQDKLKRLTGAMNAFQKQAEFLENSKADFAAANAGEMEKAVPRVERGVQQCKKILDEAKAEAGKAGVTDHPEIADAQKRLDNLSKLAADARAAMKKGEADQGTVETAPVAEKAPAGGKPLPREARQAMDKLERVLQSINGKLGMIEALKQSRGSEPSSFERKFKEMDEAVAQLDPALEEVKQAAGGADHRDVAAAGARVEEAKKKVADSQAQYKRETETKATASAGAAADVELLNKEYDRIEKEIFQPAREAAVMDANNAQPGDIKAVWARFEQFEKEQPKVKAMIEAFTQKYGATPEDIEASLKKAGYEGRRPQVEEIAAGWAKTAENRVAVGEKLVDVVKQKLSPERLNFISDFIKFDLLYGDFKTWVDMAAKLAPDSAKVKEAANTLDARVKKAQIDFAAKIDKAEWPGHSAKAPGNVKKLAAVALEWFGESPDWGRRAKNEKAQDREPQRPLAVVVTGPWSVQEKSITGAPTMYGLPILLAVQLDREKDKDVARVYQLTICTVEQGGVKPEPPFDSVRVGNSYYIRPAKVTARKE
ncbi:MAG: hypothetical protein NTV79_04005 [Candidatus Aureabacteria bacterium]|nr:hypothetical protein [Candidatus Auribacterota bacterium]